MKLMFVSIMGKFAEQLRSLPVDLPNNKKFIVDNEIGIIPNKVKCHDGSWEFKRAWASKTINNKKSDLYIDPDTVGDKEMELDVLETIVDVSIDFVKMSSLFPGRKLAVPSMLVKSFLFEWSEKSPASYRKMVKRIGVEALQPHEMHAIDLKASTDEFKSINARTWVAACSLDGMDPCDPEHLPNIYVIDERFQIYNHSIFKFMELSGGSLYWTGLKGELRPIPGASGNFEPADADTFTPVRSSKNLLGSRRKLLRPETISEKLFSNYQFDRFVGNGGGG
jgi:hypothetical protein